MSRPTYFKTMCHPSHHHFLYAAGPIGLVTAVVTLIRLSCHVQCFLSHHRHRNQRFWQGETTYTGV
jgi:hypothetical protein